MIADVVIYDPQANTWSALASLPATRRAGVAGVISGQLYYTTGWSSAMQTTTYRGQFSP